MDIREQMDKIYRDIPPDKIPWNLSAPPALLVDAVTSGRLTPCPAVDLGCGIGTYAIWMARQGFDVTGLDISPCAIDHARRLAESERVTCRFQTANLLEDLSPYHGIFDLAYDWELLHHIFPDDRERYLRNVHRLLRPKGIYFSVCFSELDPEFGGQGKYRTTPLGTVLYFSSEAELESLYTPLFTIRELTTVEIPGKYGPHTANVAWLEPK